MSRIPDGADIDSVIAFAIGRERLAQAIYRAARVAVDELRVERLLQGLEDDERRHEKLLCATYRDITGAPCDDVATEAEPAAPALASLDVVGILRLAMEKEVEARELYAESARRSEERAVTVLLERLALEEDGHFKLLEAELAGRLGGPWADEEVRTWVRDD